MDDHAEVLIINFSGNPISEVERRVMLLVSLGYIRHEKRGETRFRCMGIEGHIESKGSSMFGDFSGTSFHMDLGGEREISFFLQSAIERYGIPTDSVAFLARRRTFSGGKKHSLH